MTSQEGESAPLSSCLRARSNPSPRAPASIPFWANEQAKEVGDSPNPTSVAVPPQAGHFTALSLAFPIWAMERTVPFFFFFFFFFNW